MFSSRLEELLLRVQAILRRQPTLRSQSGTPSIRFGRNHFDPSTFRATSWDGESHTLTQREAMILIMLNEHAGSVVTRDDILERVWGHDVFPSSRTVDNFILRLRQRIEENPNDPKHILTVHGVGYKLVV